MTTGTDAIRRVFRHHGIALGVTAPPADHVWLQEFLGPTWVEDASAPARAEVWLGQEEPDAVATPQGEPVVAFALDSGPVNLAPIRWEGGERFRSPWGRVTFSVCDQGRRARVAYHQDRLAGRFYLMRVVREYAHNHAVRKGGVVLHAAGVTLGGVGIAITGPKSAGKTTLLLRALAELRAGFLANDRLLVSPDERPDAIAVPSVINLRPGTRQLHPTLAETLAVAGDWRHHAAERRSIGPAPPESYGDSWHLSPPQVCATANCAALRSAPLAAILFLGSDATRGRPRRLDSREAAATIRDSVLGCGKGALASDLFVATCGDPPGEAQIRDRCLALGEHIACVACPPKMHLDDLASTLRECAS